MKEAAFPLPRQRYGKTITIRKLPFTLHNASHVTIEIDPAVLNGSGPIRLVQCRHFALTATAPLDLSSHCRFNFEINRCSDFLLHNIMSHGGNHVLLLSESSSFALLQIHIAAHKGYGAILYNCRHFTMRHLSCVGGVSGIMILGQSGPGRMTHCQMSSLTGFMNCNAGLHLCATSPAVSPAQIPNQCHEPLNIKEKTWRPQGMVIKNCSFTDCRAQGIYLEGAVNCLIRDNLISGNNKEGICFDWGSCYNIFVHNQVLLNGERRNLGRQEQELDFITQYPLLPDGSSSIKLPGISLDNGCMNLLANNKITANYGGGIKLIRTALFNRITDNLVMGNTMGNNRYLPGFHGVALLAVGTGRHEFTGARKILLDFFPSVLNTVVNNTILEQCHGIFLDPRARTNFLENNRITINPACLHSPPRLITRIAARIRRTLHKLQISNSEKK